MIEPHSAQLGASAWAANATFVAAEVQRDRRRRAPVAVRRSLAVAVGGAPLVATTTSSLLADDRAPAGVAAAAAVASGRRRSARLGAGAGLRRPGPAAARRGRRRSDWRGDPRVDARLNALAATADRSSETTLDRSMSPRPALSSPQEARAEPAEDVVHDGLGDRDLRVAGEAAGLEPDVGELVDQVAQRHAVLERQETDVAKRVHEAADTSSLPWPS